MASSAGSDWRVVRVGGSLLTWHELPQQLAAWWAAQPPRPTLLLAGGGPWVELIRQRSAVWPLAEEDAHWLCVHLLGSTARLVALALGIPVVSSLEDLPTPHGELLVALDVESTLQSGSEGTGLPATWQVTSDSIAAFVARELAATELVLLKSCPIPAGSLEALARAEIVDTLFPEWVPSGADVRVLNLRDWQPEES